MARIDLYNIEQWNELAREAGYRCQPFSKLIDISQRQLRRYAQKAFGHSPQEWLNERRLLEAPELLKKFRSVKVVAFRLGFKQVSHFSRAFRQRYSLSPIQFLERSDHQLTALIRTC
jgi:AraC-like DNA-binding protein